MRDALPLCWFDQEECSGRPIDEMGEHSGGIEAIDHYRKEWNDKLGAFKATPLHNWASHGAKAFETFARGHLGRVSEDRATRPHNPNKRLNHRTV